MFSAPVPITDMRRRANDLAFIPLASIRLTSRADESTAYAISPILVTSRDLSQPTPLRLTGTV